MKSLTDTYQLSNGVDIPCVGFGTWQMEDGKQTVDATLDALETGYRHIDTAAIYGNERSVGSAVKESGIAREDLFITSKLWNDERGYESTLAAFDQTLERLQLDYLDLYLIHWPASESRTSEWQQLNSDTWRAFERLYRDQRIRAIGVSNFLPHHLEPLIARAEITPMVDQIEFHPGKLQQETVDFCRSHSMLVEAWSPLGSGKMLHDQSLKDMAARYSTSIAQLCIRWCLQHGTLPLPKSANEPHIRQNADVFDFEISPEDMNFLDTMPNIGDSGLHPDTNKF